MLYVYISIYYCVWVCVCVCVSMGLNWGRFCPPPSPCDICLYLETFLIVTSVCVEGLLASSGQSPGMLLNIPQCTGQSPTQRISQPQMPIVPRLINPEKNIFTYISVIIEGDWVTAEIAVIMKKQSLSTRLNILPVK